MEMLLEIIVLEAKKCSHEGRTWFNHRVHTAIDGITVNKGWLENPSELSGVKRIPMTWVVVEPIEFEKDGQVYKTNRIRIRKPA